MTWTVLGQPVPWAGEEPERRWRETLRGQSPSPSEKILAALGASRSLELTFHVHPNQVLGMPDLDNLMVPVVEELRGLRWFSRGFSMLDRITLRKARAEDELGVGVRIEIAPAKSLSG